MKARMSGNEYEDLFILVVGAEGTGKTLLTVYLSCKIDKKYDIDSVFIFKDQLDEMYRHIIANDDYCRVLHIDEPKIFDVHHASIEARENRELAAGIRSFRMIHFLLAQSMNRLPDGEIAFRRADALIFVKRSKKNRNIRIVKFYLGEEWDEKGLLMKSITKKDKKWTFGIPNATYYFNKNELLKDEKVRRIFLATKQPKKEYLLKILDKNRKQVKLRRVFNIAKLHPSYVNPLIDESGIAYEEKGARNVRYASMEEAKKFVFWLLENKKITSIDFENITRKIF